MNLEEYCKTLKKSELLGLAIKMCGHALPIWERYASLNRLEYRDSVTGVLHHVQKEILSMSIQFCKKEVLNTQQWEQAFDNLNKEFADPNAAIQNFDWELPYSVEKVFQATFNLLRGLKEPVNLFDEQTHYVSINQAADALQSSGLMGIDEIKEIISSYKLFLEKKGSIT